MARNSGYVDKMMKKYYPKRYSQVKGKTTYGKPFRKKSSRGKFKKGTWIKYKYVNGRRVGSVKSRK
jgi:hypothetical protein